MADRYWVGGTGDFTDNTNHWAATSGGAPGASLPTSSDNIIFDVLSNLTGYVVTLNASGLRCLSCTVAAPATGNVTFAGGTIFWNITGSLTLYSGMVWTSTVIITFDGTGAQTITTAGTSLTCHMGFNATGSWTLQDNVTTTGNMSVDRGTLALNGHNFSCALFNSDNGSIRALNLTNGTLSCSGGLNQTIWNTTDLTNMTLTTTGSTVVVTTTNNDPSGLVAPAIAKFGGIVLNNLTLSSINYSHMALNGPVTASGVLTIAGQNATTGRLHLHSTVLGTPRTITANGSTALSNADFEDITIAGSASPAGGTSLGNCGGNTGITTTAPVTRFWVGNGGDMTDTAHWSATSGGTSGASMPLPQDTALFNGSSFSSGGQNITIAVNLYRTGTVNFAGVTNTPSFVINRSTFFYGSVLFTTGMTIGAVNDLLFYGRGAYNFTAPGIDWINTIILEAIGGTYTLQSNVGSAVAGQRARLLHFQGTFDANDFDVYLTKYSGSGALNRSLLMGNGTWYLGIQFDSQWDLTNTTNLTFNPENSTIEMQSFTSGFYIAFVGGGKTYPHLRINRTVAGTVYLDNSNTYGTISCISTVAHDITFQAGTTMTFGSWLIQGAPGKVFTINCSAAANYNFVYTGLGVVDADYLSISRSQATPGALTWYAGSHSTNGGNNSGWIFADAPHGPTAYVVMMF